MNAREFDFSMPPYEAVMPAAAQETMTWIAIAMVSILVVSAVRMASQYKSALPLLLLAAAGLNIINEPLVCYLGHALHPEIGQNTAFKAFDRAIPWHLVLIYGAGTGSLYLSMYKYITTNSFTRVFLWKTWLAVCVIGYLFEIIPVQAGLWIYYDNQAWYFWKGGMPALWPFLNATCMILPLTLIKYFYPILKGYKQLLVLALSPTGAIMGSIASGWPFFAATNADVSQLTVELAGTVTFVLSLIIVWACINVLVSDSKTAVRSESSPALNTA